MQIDRIECEGYAIEDPRPVRAENPYSFYLPCRARLEALATDDHVKAIFTPLQGDGDGGSERMWLQIVGTDGDTLRCTLQNQPFGIEALNHGDAVEIRRHHVIDIETQRADDPPETNGNDQYFERCLVDERIIAGTPIHRIVRDEPEPADYHGKDRFGWTGWRFEAEGYAPDTATGTYALVVPMRRESGYADMLDAPAGTVIERDGDGWRITTPLN